MLDLKPKVEAKGVWYCKASLSKGRTSRRNSPSRNKFKNNQRSVGDLVL